MSFDPSNPPIWLRKLHVTAAEIDSSDYAATPEEGILRVCRLSDEMGILAMAFAESLGMPPLPPSDPFDSPLSLHRLSHEQSSESPASDAAL
jgi:hypothetical protein